MYGKIEKKYIADLGRNHKTRHSCKWNQHDTSEKDNWLFKISARLQWRDMPIYLYVLEILNDN